MSELASVARVAYEAVGLSDFQADNARAEASYRSSVGGMSDEAIKFRLAQDRLQRTLQKGPSAFREQARAEIALRNAERQLRGETDSLTRSQERNRRGIVGLRGSLVGLAASYIGAQGIINLTRASVNAARDEELVMGQTRVAIEARGEAYDRIAPKLARQIRLVQRLGFDDEELAKSFQTLSGSAGSLEEAMAQLNLVAGVARGRYIDLESATQVVNKANLGMSGALRRIGIDVDKNASRVQLLTALNERYGRSAVEAADSGAAAADRFSVAIEETQESIGRGLAPTVADLSDRVTKWINVAENQEELQRRVNDAVEKGETAVRGIARGLGIAEAATRPLVSALGGLENVITAITLLWAANKAKALLGFAGIATASRATSARMIADATAAGRAWDIATRPRVMPVATMGGGVPGGAGGRGAIPGTSGRFGGGLVGVGAVVLGTALLGDLGGAPSLREQQRRVSDVARVDPKAALRLARDFAREFGSPLTDLLDRNPFGASGLTAPNRDPVGSRGDRDRPNMGRAVPTPPTRGSGGGRGRFTFNRYSALMSGLDEDALDAAATPGSSDDVRIERARLALARRALRELELTRDQRMAVKNERNRALQAIAAIEQASDQEAAQIREERERKAAERKRKERERLNRILDQAEKVAERRGDLFAGVASRSDSRAGLRQLALRGVKGTVTALKEGEGKPVTAAELRRILHDLMKDLNSLREFGSNFAEGSAAERTATHASAQTDILMEMSRQQGMLIRGQWHPGAQYAGNELAVAGTGVGF